MKTSQKQFVPVLLGLMLVCGCTSITRNPLPVELANQAEVEGMKDVRAWGSEYSPVFQADLIDSIRQATRGNSRGVVGPNGYVNVLAISGGGANGAFGAGLLCGWTKAGDRPDFKLVTGISTGALIAPFAFVGPEYDHILKRFYTSVSTPDIYTPHSLLTALMGDALADTSPLARLLEQIVDEKLLAAVAKAHSQGRRLYIGTTNLDAGRLMVWNMGAIATHGGPQALDLFRKIMRASAAIPVMFPPVYMPVMVNGKKYDEMHVDGGTCSQVFFYGFMLDLPAAISTVAKEQNVKTRPPVRIYVIRNARIRSDYVTVAPRLFPIAGRSVDDLLQTQGIGDLYRIYTIATRDGIDFKLASIPLSFVHQGKEAFDRGDMTRLFDLAFDLAAKGYSWENLPPGLKERPSTDIMPPVEVQTRPAK